MREQFASPMDLLFDEESLLLGIEAEDAVGGNIGAGLDWGSAIGQLMLNPGLFSRLTTLRVSLNREVRWAKPRLRRSLLNDWKKGNCDFCCNFYSTGAPAPKVENAHPSSTRTHRGYFTEG